MDTRRHTRPVLEQGGSGQLAGVLGKTKTEVVVPVVCVVPVAVGRAEGFGFVVPRTPANHPPGHVWPPPRVNTMREKMDLRKPSVSAWLDSGEMPYRSLMFAVAGASVVAPSSPSLDAGFRHPCRNDGP